MSIFTVNIRFFRELTSISNKQVPDEEKATKADFILLFVMSYSILESILLHKIENKLPYY